MPFDPHILSKLARVAAVSIVAALGTASVAQAAPYREDTGPAADVAPGAVMVIHGGGWTNGSGWVINHRPVANRFNGQYTTVNTDYAPTGDAAMADLTAAYDDLRARMPGKPICLIGVSAGGHYALMLAQQRNDVACVISEAGPTLLTAINTTVQSLALKAFGYAPGTLERWSPALHTDAMSAPVLLGYATDDPLVTYDQGTAFAQRYPAARLIGLPGGSVNYVHSQVDPAALDGYYAAEQQFVADSMRAWTADRTPAPAPVAAPAPVSVPANVPASTPKAKQDRKRKAKGKRRAHRRAAARHRAARKQTKRKRAAKHRRHAKHHRHGAKRR